MDPSDDNPPGSGPPRPVPAGGGRSEERRGGFGAGRWRDDEPTSVPQSVESADPNVPFGGSGWSGSPGLTDLPDEPAREPEAKPTGRRRKPKGPTHVRRTLAALGSAVDVVRDDQARVHIYAKSERDAYAALGFCMAEDRLDQMDSLRVAALGRNAERLGATWIRHDALVRTLGIPRRAQASASRLDGAPRELLASFAGGVNAGRALAGSGGDDVEPWTLADSLAIELYLSWNLAAAFWARKVLAASAITVGNEQLARSLLGPDVRLPLPSDPRVKLWRRIDPRILDLVVSEWSGAPGGHVSALSAQQSGGAAALCASLELPATGCGSMYPASLEFSGTKVVGVAHLGMPALFAGRSEDMAWGVVPSVVDDSDCVVEELDGIGGFRMGTRWEKLRRRRETIRVQDGESVRLEIAETRNGPLLSHLIEQLDGAPADIKPLGLALRWGPNSLGTALGGLRLLPLARTPEELVDVGGALDKSPLAMEVVTADRHGAVARTIGGATPVRDAKAALPVCGWEGEAGWTGRHALSASEPSLAAGGFSCAVGRVAPGSSGPSLDWRRSRLETLLSASRDANALLACSADTLDGPASELLPRLREFLAGTEAERLVHSRQLLEQWDGTAQLTSCGASLYYAALFSELPQRAWPAAGLSTLKKLPDVGLQAILGLLEDSSGRVDVPASGRVDVPASVIESFEAAESWLGARFGADPLQWTWGRVQVASPAENSPSESRAEDQESPAVVGGMPPRREEIAGSPFTVLGNRFGGGTEALEVRVSPAVRVLVDFSTNDVAVAGNGIDCVFALGQRPPNERVELIPG